MIRKEFLVSKRSEKKEYLPSYYELAAGGICGVEEDIDEVFKLYIK